MKNLPIIKDTTRHRARLTFLTILCGSFLACQSGFTQTVPAGVWSILQVSGKTISTPNKTQVTSSLGNPGVVGFGLRFPWNVMETGRITTSALVAATTNPSNNPIGLTGSGLPVALAQGAVLNFDYGSFGTPPQPMPVDVYVTLTASAPQGATTIYVGPISAPIYNKARAGIYDDTVLNNGYALPTAVGKNFKPRVMCGQYTPAWVFSDGAVGYPISPGSQISAPYPFIDSQGDYNATFEMAYRQMVRHLNDWATAKNVTTPGSVSELDLGWHSLQYSELYYGPEIQTAWGGTAATNAPLMVAACNHLVTIALQETNTIPIGYGLSGQGPLAPYVAPQVAAGMQAEAGAYSASLYMQANGWDQSGYWGSAQESTFDANVWPNEVRRGLQDIGIGVSGDRSVWDWDTMFAKATSVGATYLEIYSTQFGSGVINGIDTGNPLTGGNPTIYNEMLSDIQHWTPVIPVPPQQYPPQ